MHRFENFLNIANKPTTERAILLTINKIARFFCFGGPLSIFAQKG